MSQARAAEEKGQFYIPLGKISRFNQKIKNLAASDLKVIKATSDYETISDSSFATTEVDNPMLNFLNKKFCPSPEKIN